MSLLQARAVWGDFTGSSAGTAVDFRGYGLENTFYVQSGAASSGTVTIETAITAAGPWATIASTTVSATGSLAVMQVTGPFLFVRPRFASTGTWTVQAVSFG